MKMNKKNNLQNFTKLTYRGGISLIVLVITIIVIIILAAAVILTINNNNPVTEANKARYESDRANMQAVFTAAVAKVMTHNRATISITAGQVNTDTSGSKEVTGEVAYTVTNAMNKDNTDGTIVFGKGNNTDTVFYTGKLLPVYAAGETKWYVDEEGNITLEVAGVKYGEGVVTDIPSSGGSGSIDTSKGVIAPQLPTGAKAVKWVNNVETETEITDSEWYNYIVQSGVTTTGGTSKWANCKLEDGSYFVWIPRYAYKLDKTAQTIDVKFTKYENGVDVAIDGTSLDGYIVHPAFTNNVAAGGWDAELAGLWVAKYKAGKINTEDNEIVSSISGYNLPVFKPNRTSYKNQTIGESYTIAKEYNSNLNSHMLKNSEWGAVAYLTHSKYGRNGTEVTINNSGITGNAANEVSDTTYKPYSVINEYNTDKGMLASTTGNIYGIYDLSGGEEEFTAGYINNGKQTDAGGYLITDGGAGNSTKYKTVYAYSSSNDRCDINYDVAENISRVGEAIWETSTSGAGANSWNDDFSDFPTQLYPFTLRGGYYNSGSKAGIFAFGDSVGRSPGMISFRIALVSLL